MVEWENKIVPIIRITDKLRKSITVDWQYKDSVRAKMRTLIRIALRSYKYPPDLQAEAIEFVLQQAEEIAGELVEDLPNA